MDSYDINQLKLNDVLTSGIFIKYTNGFPWGEAYNEDIASIIDDELLGNYGECVISPRLKRYVKSNYTTTQSILLTDEQITQLSNTFNLLYKDSLTHMYGLLELQYDPIANYDRKESTTVTDDYTEDMTGNSTTTNNLKSERTGNNTDNTTSNETQNGTSNNNDNETQNIFGFNSSDPSPQNQKTSTVNNTVDNKVDRTNETTSTISETVDDTGTVSIDNTNNKTNKGSRTTESSISGNIGVTTSQQMMESELEFWRWSFYEDVIKMMKTYLCSGYYTY